MKITRKITALMLLTTLCLPISNLNAKQITDVADTFTYDNIDNVHAVLGESEYMITAENSIVGRGNGLYGASATSRVNTTEWTPIPKTAVGHPFDNVVRLRVSDGVLYISTADGEVYTLGGSTYVPKLLTGDIDEYVVGYSNSNGLVTSIAFKDKIRTTISGTTEFELNSDIRHFDSYTNSRSASYDPYYYGSVILTEDNKLRYVLDGKLNEALDKDGNYLGDVLDFKVIKYNDVNARILTTNNKINTYNLVTKAISPIPLYKDGVDVTKDAVVTSILNRSDRNGKLAITTNLGVFEGSTVGYNGQIELHYNEELTELNPVTVSSYTVIGQDGKLSTTKNKNSFKDYATEEFQKWQYDNPILPTSILANFEINHGDIYNRKSNVDVTFSLVSYTEPKAFNLYYAKVDKMMDKSNWKVIEQNVSVGSLNAKEYDTGYTLVNGDKISGYTYTYDWKISKEDLTNIQLIVEPIY